MDSLDLNQTAPDLSGGQGGAGSPPTPVETPRETAGVIIYTTGYRDNCRVSKDIVFEKPPTKKELKQLQRLYRDAEDHYEIIDWLESHGFKPLKPVKSKKLEEHESHPLYDISWADIYEITDNMLPLIVISYRENFCNSDEYNFWMYIVDKNNLEEWTRPPFRYDVRLSEIINDATVVKNRRNVDISNADKIVCRQVANVIGDLREGNYETYECITENNEELFAMKEYAVIRPAEVGTKKVYLEKPRVYIE